MLPDRVSNPGPLTYESGALPIALRGPASCLTTIKNMLLNIVKKSMKGPVKIFSGQSKIHVRY